MPPCWGCEPLLADPSLYADLRRLSEDEKGSLTCQYLGLTTGCCLTLTFIFPIVLLILFGLMRLRPAFIVLSLIVLPPMCFFLSWVMFIEFLRCVVAWFVLVSGWLIGTVLYALRRRHKYKANWLQRNPDDDDTRPADLVSSAIASRSRVTEGLGDMFASESSPGAGRRSSRASSEASAAHTSRLPPSPPPSPPSPLAACLAVCASNNMKCHGAEVGCGGCSTYACGSTCCGGLYRPGCGCMWDCHEQHACGGCTAGEPCHEADNPCAAGEVCSPLLGLQNSGNSNFDNGDGTGWGTCSASYLVPLACHAQRRPSRCSR